VAYRSDTQRADVKLDLDMSVWDDDGGREYEEVPILADIPVVFPRGGGYVVTFPLAVDDQVQVFFSEASLGEWRTTGQHSQPSDARRHSVGWPWCVPGLYPDTKPLAAGDQTAREAGMVIGRDGQTEQVRVKTGVIEIGVGTLQAVALEQKIKAWLDDIRSTFNSHTHYVAGVEDAPHHVPRRGERGVCRDAHRHLDRLLRPASKRDGIEVFLCVEGGLARQRAEPHRGICCLIVGGLAGQRVHLGALVVGGLSEGVVAKLADDADAGLCLRGERAAVRPALGRGEPVKALHLLLGQAPPCGETDHAEAVFPLAEADEPGNVFDPLSRRVGLGLRGRRYRRRGRRFRQRFSRFACL
jgi:hypothetical protein